MNTIFNPTNIVVDSYDYCGFTFLDGHTSHWGNIPDDVKEGTSDTKHSIVTSLPRVNSEYNSPLMHGEFPTEGCFAIDSTSIINEAGESQSIVLNKMFIPKGCVRVYLYNYDEDASCTIERTYGSSETQLYEVNYSVLVTFSSQPDPEVSAEIIRHELNQVIRTDYGFEFAPHELQVNGSEILVSFRDLLHSYRDMYMSNNYISCSEFQNFSLARNYSKFYIGAPVNE